MLRARLKSEVIDFLKKGDRKRVEVLRYLVSLLDKRELQLPVGTMNEEEELVVLSKELKNKLESREIFLKANRGDLVEQLEFEIEVLKGYLPEALSEEEVERMVDELVARLGKDMGKVMREARATLGGRVDGAKLAEVVKAKIAG